MKYGSTRFTCVLIGFFNFIGITILTKALKLNLSQLGLVGFRSAFDDLIEYQMIINGLILMILALFASIHFNWAKWIIVAVIIVDLCIAFLGIFGSYFPRLIINNYEFIFANVKFSNTTKKLQKKLKCCGWGTPVQYSLIGNCKNFISCDEVIYNSLHVKNSFPAGVFILMTLLDIYALVIIFSSSNIEEEETVSIQI